MSLRLGGKGIRGEIMSSLKSNSMDGISKVGNLFRRHRINEFSTLNMLSWRYIQTNQMKMCSRMMNSQIKSQHHLK